MIELTEKDAQRFWSYVEKGDSCWLWRGAQGTRYGMFVLCRGGKAMTRGAHRIAFKLECGDPGDLCVLHQCDNPLCVRPDHLFLGTHADNIADKVAKGRQAKGDRHGTKTCPESVRRGASNGMSKLDEQSVREIRCAIARGESREVIAEVWGVSRSNIGMIARRETWSHV